MPDFPFHLVDDIDHLASPRDVQAVDLGSDAYLLHTTVGPMDNNCWFIVSAHGDAILIDACADAEHLLSLAANGKFRITDVVTTHRHSDHVQALEQVIKSTDARHHAGLLDAPALPVAVDETYGDAEESRTETLRLAGHFGNLEFPVATLTGHTPGGIAVLAIDPQRFKPERAFVGDSIFPGGVGKTESKEQFETLLGDVERKIFALPETTVIHPGHGDSTTVGAEKPHVDEWRTRGW